MSSAIGGVDTCITAPITDPEAELNLPRAGEYTLEGYEVLGFIRTRYGVGDGGDLSRLSNQRSFMSSMIRTLQSEGDALFERIRTGERFVPEEPENGTVAAEGTDARAEAPPSPEPSGEATVGTDHSGPPVLAGVCRPQAPAIVVEAYARRRRIVRPSAPPC